MHLRSLHAYLECYLAPAEAADPKEGPSERAKRLTANKTPRDACDAEASIQVLSRRCGHTNPLKIRTQAVSAILLPVLEIRQTGCPCGYSPEIVHWSSQPGCGVNHQPSPQCAP